MMATQDGHLSASLVNIALKVLLKYALTSYSRLLYISSSEQVTLYHYTDKKGVEGIKKDNIIMVSTDTATDAAFGEGKSVVCRLLK